MISTYDFVGSKRLSGTNSKGVNYDFISASLVGPWSQFEVERFNGLGVNAFSVAVPDQCQDVFSQGNIGKKVDVDLYYAKGKMNIAYAKLHESRK